MSEIPSSDKLAKAAQAILDWHEAEIQALKDKHDGDFKKSAEFFLEQVKELCEKHEKELAAQREACAMAAWGLLDPVNFPKYSQGVKQAIISARPVSKHPCGDNPELTCIHERCNCGRRKNIGD